MLAPVRSTLGQTWWQDLLKTGVSTTADIFKQRYGVPPAGTIIRTPQGEIIRSGPSSFPVFGPGVGTSPISSQWLLWGGLGLAALVVIGSMGRR